VVWKARNVVDMDEMEEMNDLFAKVWFEGCAPQETDVHWRAQNGKGSFNWRMKFKLKLGPRSMHWKFPYLHLQLWDKDVVSFNDCMGAGGGGGGEGCTHDCVAA